MFNRSIFANSFGECILQKIYDEPIETHGTRNTLTNACIGPVPAFDTFKIKSPKASFALLQTISTIFSCVEVLAAAYAFKTLIVTSSKPFLFR